MAGRHGRPADRPCRTVDRPCSAAGGLGADVGRPYAAISRLAWSAGRSRNAAGRLGAHNRSTLLAESLDRTRRIDRSHSTGRSTLRARSLVHSRRITRLGALCQSTRSGGRPTWRTGRAMRTRGWPTRCCRTAYRSCRPTDQRARTTSEDAWTMNRSACPIDLHFQLADQSDRTGERTGWTDRVGSVAHPTRRGGWSTRRRGRVIGCAR